MTYTKRIEELFTELNSVFKEELPCEIIMHGKDRYHPDVEEPGVWYISSKCNGCELTQTQLACNTFRNALLEAGPDSETQCGSCGITLVSKTFITSMVRR